MVEFKITASPKSEAILLKERKYSAHNYTPIPIVYESAQGLEIVDVDGNKYLDFGASYGATNQGHNHPKIVKAVVDQYSKLSLPSRAFTHNLFAEFCEFLCNKFGFEKILPINGGGEAVEFAIKLCRSWGYVKKGIPPNEAKVLMCASNYHGRSVSVISGSTNESARKNYGPFVPKIGPSYIDSKGENKLLKFNDVASLEDVFKSEGDKIAGVIIESVQGEGGIFVPDDYYFDEVRKLCDKYNVLWVADEIQVGNFRCGSKIWAFENFKSTARPDVLITAKSITGGLYPCSIVMSSKEIMDTIEPNSHGGTFSGSPISCIAAIAGVNVMYEEKMGDNAEKLSPILINGLKNLQSKYDLIKEVRGKGLIAAFVVDDELLGKANGMNAWHVCMYLRAKGIACKPVHGNIIRWCPALIITQEELEFALSCLEDCCKELLSLKPSEIPDVDRFHFMAH